MSDTLKISYQKMQTDLHASESLIQHTLAAAYPEKKAHSTPRIRTAALIASFILLIVAAIPAMFAAAAGRNLFYDLYPEVAKVILGNRSDDNEGVRLTVESVSIHGDTAEVYFSLQDLIGKRINGNTAMIDNYRLDLNEKNLGEITQTCRFLRYDEKTEKAHYLITTSNTDGDQMIIGSRITLTLGYIIAGRYTARSLNAGIDITAVNTDPETVNTTLNYWANMHVITNELKTRMGTDLDDNARYNVLKPGASLYNIAPDIDITAAGYKDGILRLQVCHDGTMSQKDLYGAIHEKGMVYLTEKANEENVLDCTLMATYFIEGDTRFYTEYFFDLPQEELANYNLAFWFMPYSDVIDGNWRVTIPAEQFD